MIVKNEEKYLERCLSALKPILDGVESELIITDTGSEDRTVEIAKKYTNNLFFFKWNNDFSAARNYGLKQASGEWFMFLDADEIFLSCDGIISFFTSDEYKKFNSATFTIRSLYSDGTSSDFDANRLTKRLQNTSFFGIIHETLNTFGEPVKKLGCVAEHYGYLSNDRNDEKSKFERNSKLLLKKYKIYGDKDPIIYLQLYECFYRYDRITSEKYLDSGIRICERRKSPVLIALYCHKAHLMYFDEKYIDTLAVCDKYFGMNKQIRPNPITTDCEMTAFKASSFYNIGRYHEAIQAYTLFFQLFTENEDGKSKTPDANMLVYYLATEKNLAAALYEFLSSCINLNESHSASSVLSLLHLYRYHFNTDHAKIIVSMLAKLESLCVNGADAEIINKKITEIINR